MVAINHTQLLSTWNVATVTEEFELCSILIILNLHSYTSLVATVLEWTESISCVINIQKLRKVGKLVEILFRLEQQDKKKEKKMTGDQNFS